MSELKPASSNDQQDVTVGYMGPSGPVFTTISYNHASADGLSRAVEVKKGELSFAEADSLQVIGNFAITSYYHDTTD